MPNAVLVINAGSSSIKFAVFDAEAAAWGARWRGQIEALGLDPVFSVSERGEEIAKGRALPDRGAGHDKALAFLLDWVFERTGRQGLLAVGHRIVHGGADFCGPVRVDERVIAALERLIPLAPLHQPHNVAGLKAIAAAAPDLPQVACFDTAFHRTMPAVASALALPRHLSEAGLRRYGFHGLSYEHIASILPEHLSRDEQERVIVAHLGNGASLCAMRKGESIETTMGFTALEGLMMGTRGGSLDPGVLLHLMREHGYDADALQDLLYRRSGLIGVSGLSSDMRALLASDEPGARLAIDLFVYRALREIGALTACLGGLDSLVFTAGIGERSPTIRARICAGLAWLGLSIDEAANAASARRISAKASVVAVFVLPTDEESVIARHTLATASGLACPLPKLPPSPS